MNLTLIHSPIDPRAVSASAEGRLRTERAGNGHPVNTGAWIFAWGREANRRYPETALSSLPQIIDAVV